MLLRLSESADILYSSWSAGYRPDGLRGSKTASSTTTYFLYDGATPVAELNSSGTITALNVFGADGLIGRVVPGGTDIQYLFDHQGNVAQRLDGSGSVVSKSTYDAYGAESSTSTPTDPFGYNAQSGYYLDRETGLYLCTYRYYDPAKGRWLNRDPIGYAGGMNLYGYCGAGPVGAIDLLGFQRTTYDQISDGFAKFGDAITEMSQLGMLMYPVTGDMSLTGSVRKLFGYDDNVEEDSTGGKAGYWLGFVACAVSPEGDVALVADKAASTLLEKEITEGIYLVMTKEGKPYIGQSSTIWERLLAHVRVDKITRGAAESAVRTHVPGGRVAREIAEQEAIDAHGGILSRMLANVRNPIGKGRRHLLR